jgi:putative flippase GtrA
VLNERGKVMVKELYIKYKEVINYLVFGVLTTVVNIVVYFVFADVLHVQYLISNCVAWFLSVLFAYVTNRKYVFESKSNSIAEEMSKFFASRLATGALDMVLMWLLVSMLCVNGVVSKVLANVVVVVSNYILSKLVVFK